MEFLCPLCTEEFDFVGLCCHIEDEHAVESKNGVCPICAARIGMDLVGHLTTQHPSCFKIPQRRRVRKASSESYSLLSLLRKDLRDGSLQSLIGGSSHVPPTAAASDPFLSSLLYTSPASERNKGSESSVNDFLADNKKTEDKSVRRAEPSLSEKDQKEMAQRSQYVRELVLSAIFDDDL